MKTEVFNRKDGTKGERFVPQNGDEFVSEFEKVGERENLTVVNNKAVKIMNYFLGIKDKDGKVYTITITGGQKKVLDKTENLKGKTIVFENYEHKTYGTLIGARVKK